MKRVIVCCDGTWNDIDRQSEDTNVFRMARAIHATQKTDALQITLYLRGVGATGLRIEKLVEGGIGLGVDDNIRSAYMFIAQNYVPKDEIFLFGFSRGAYTVRSLAGLINACGILKRQKLGDLPNAWAYYRSEPPPHSPQDFQTKYKTDCHADAEIRFLGVWDTVGALGIPGGLFSPENAKKFAFHDTGPCAAMKRGCHALAIDEHRHEFVPTLWTEPAPDGVKIEQVWFAGAHADVGGGYVTRELADIPLVWMAKKAEQDGLALDWGCLPDPDALQDLAASHEFEQRPLLVRSVQPDLSRSPAEAVRRFAVRAPLCASRRRRASSADNQRSPAPQRRQSLPQIGARVRDRRRRNMQLRDLRAAQPVAAVFKRRRACGGSPRCRLSDIPIRRRPWATNSADPGHNG